MRRATVAGVAALGYLIGTFPTADLVAERASSGTIKPGRAGSGNLSGSVAA